MRLLFPAFVGTFLAVSAHAGPAVKGAAPAVSLDIACVAGSPECAAAATEKDPGIAAATEDGESSGVTGWLASLAGFPESLIPAPAPADPPNPLPSDVAPAKAPAAPAPAAEPEETDLGGVAGEFLSGLGRPGGLVAFAPGTNGAAAAASADVAPAPAAAKPAISADGYSYSKIAREIKDGPALNALQQKSPAVP